MGVAEASGFTTAQKGFESQVMGRPCEEGAEAQDDNEPRAEHGHQPLNSGRSYGDSPRFLAAPRFPLKGFFKGDTDMDIDVDVVMTEGS